MGPNLRAAPPETRSPQVLRLCAHTELDQALGDYAWEPGFRTAPVEAWRALDAILWELLEHTDGMAAAVDDGGDMVSQRLRPRPRARRPRHAPTPPSREVLARPDAIPAARRRASPRDSSWT